MEANNQFEDFDIQVADVTKPEEPQPVEVQTEEQPAEEVPAAEQPAEEPVNEEPVKEEPVQDVPETTAQEPVAETTEPAVETEELTAAEEPETEEPAAEEPTIAQLKEQIEALTRQNELLLKKFDDKIAMDEHKAQLFDKMYNELQAYKNDLYAKLLKPFILSAITLLDDTNTFIGKLGENEAPLAEKYLRTMPDDIIDLLESNGVILYEDDSEKFNPKTQRVMKKVPTDKPELDNAIAKRLRKGYNWNGVNMRPELVWIYKYNPEAEA